MSAAGAWYRAGKVSVTKGSKVVVGKSTSWKSAVNKIQVGDIFTADSKTFYEIVGITDDSNLTLDRNFEGSTSSNHKYAIIRNTSATINSVLAGQVAKQLNQKQLFLDELTEWLSSDNPTEPLTDGSGVEHDVKTPAQMEKEFNQKLSNIDDVENALYLRTKEQDEAMRAANNEKYAASGFVHFGKHRSNSDSTPINIGLWSRTNTAADANILYTGRSVNSVAGTSKQEFPVINIGGNLVDLVGQNNPFGYEIKFPDAPDGTVTYDSATGTVEQHADSSTAFAAETATNKVVTERVDMWGFEQYLRNVTPTDPYVYPNGLIQSRATTINGVATSPDTVRPITYFAVFDGDTTSRGRGVHWFNATEEQRKAIAADPKNNIRYDAETGNVQQWCLRQRTVAGAGNGDWENVLEANKRDLRFGISNWVKPQGALDYRAALADDTLSGYGLYTWDDRVWGGNRNRLTGKGKFNAATSDSNRENLAVNRECYFLVCGTVVRLNQGAYHPSFNPFGAAYWQHQGGTPAHGTFDKFGRLINSAAQCFSFLSTSGNPRPYPNTGLIGQTSGRPDNRFYNAIYASGMGGVQEDIRYSVYEPDAQEIARQIHRHAHGEARGLQKLVKTIVRAEVASSSANANGTQVLDASLYRIGDVVSVVEGVNIHIQEATIVAINANTNTILWNNQFFSRVGNTSYHIVHTQEIDTSVAGEFLTTGITSSTQRILDNPDLVNGWLGHWIPDLESGNKDLIREAVSALLSGTVVTSDNGASYSTGVNRAMDFSYNRTVSDFNPQNLTGILHYTTNAYLTQDANHLAPYGYGNGLKQVYAGSSTSATAGSQLNESLLRKVTTSTNAWTDVNNLSITNHVLDKNGELVSGRTSHTPLTLPAPTNGSDGVKALVSVVEQNGQLHLQYNFNQLKYSSGNWGDDSSIAITDGRETRPDLNNQNVEYGTAVSIALGWAKKDK